jgi:Fic family protein
MQGMGTFIYQKADWPNFTWENEVLISLLSEARNLQGRLIGKMEALGFELSKEALLQTLTSDVIKTSEIEGEYLDPDQVRSSIARKLRMEIAGSVESDRNVDGVVDMMVDATENCFNRMTTDRLFAWHAALFPTGRSGMYKITVGNWRQDTTGPMQVVSGALGKERIHFQAADSVHIEKEMNQFLDWYNEDSQIDLVLKAAIAHLWFVTIHPFEDGNGRICRALTDLLLARSDKSNQRYFSLSAQIRLERKHYYEVLEKTQKGNLDLTDWIKWFLNCLINSLNSTQKTLETILAKAKFWTAHANTALNQRQKMLLNKLLDGFEGKLTSSKWAKIGKCSNDTAIRDINDLIDKGILQRGVAGGRSTTYELKL